METTGVAASLGASCYTLTLSSQFYPYKVEGKYRGISMFLRIWNPESRKPIWISWKTEERWPLSMFASTRSSLLKPVRLECYTLCNIFTDSLVEPVPIGCHFRRQIMITNEDKPPFTAEEWFKPAGLCPIHYAKMGFMCLLRRRHIFLAICTPKTSKKSWPSP